MGRVRRGNLRGLDEAIRRGPAANHFLRYITQVVQLPGGTIPAGDAAALWLSSANPDEKVFDDPFTFDIRPPTPQHLGFGVGPHYCVGGLRPHPRRRPAPRQVERIRSVGAPTDA